MNAYQFLKQIGMSNAPTVGVVKIRSSERVAKEKKQAAPQFDVFSEPATNARVFRAFRQQIDLVRHQQYLVLIAYV
jgi:hypothetical protein